MLSFLEGKKTYILSGLSVVATIAFGFGWIDIHVYATILGLLGGGSAATIHSAIVNNAS